VSAWSPPRREQVFVAVGAAVLVAGIAFAHGGYFPREWGWGLLAVALVALMSVLVRERLSLGRLELAAVGLWTAFAAWTAASTIWSVSAAQPVLATERTLLYVTALLAALLVTRSRHGSVPLAAGVVVASTVVGGYALLTRLVPGWISRFPPSDGYQLQAPIGYWNGLAILAAVGALAALGLAAEAEPRALRAGAAAAVPPLVLCVYFTFSRGGWLALAAGAAAAVALSPRRLHLLGVIAALAPATALAVWCATRFPALTHGGSSLGTARTDGRDVLIVLLLCTAGAAAAGSLLPSVEARIRLSRRADRLISGALAAIVALALLAALVHVGGPTGLWNRASSSFNRSLPQTGGDLNRRLTSFSSDGRADYWRVAWREVRAHPLLGGGAGSYERWWARYRPTGFEARNAHNLYLETLAELGPVGLVLLLGALAVPFAAAVRRRAEPGVAAAAGVLAAFAVHAAVDWDFQIPAVTLPALLCSAALVSATRRREEQPVPPRVRFAVVGLLLPVTAAAVAIQVGNSALANASAALDRGDVRAAERLARRARTWQPWSYEPWQVLAEAALAQNRAPEARADLQRALARDRLEWSLWDDLAQASNGRARAQALREARRLNPRAGD
jgi:O-Antigen ligase